MADYRSTLTGTQMDSALLDMAEHNSEAYAVGERNGIAVASDDVTWHNNAKYYAELLGGILPDAQAAAAAAQAAAAIAQSISSGNVLFHDYRDGTQYYMAFGASADGYPMVTLEEVA